MISDKVMGHLSLEDIELRIWEHKISLMCSPAPAYGGLVKQGGYIKDGISHWDAHVCTLAKPRHAGALPVFPATSRTSSLAQRYVNKQAAKAPAPLPVGNEDIVVSTLRKAVSFGSARRSRSKRLWRWPCQVAVRCHKGPRSEDGGCWWHRVLHVLSLLRERLSAFEYFRVVTHRCWSDTAEACWTLGKKHLRGARFWGPFLSRPLI